VRARSNGLEGLILCRDSGKKRSKDSFPQMEKNDDYIEGGLWSATRRHYPWEEIQGGGWMIAAWNAGG